MNEKGLKKKGEKNFTLRKKATTTTTTTICIVFISKILRKRGRQKKRKRKKKKFLLGVLLKISGTELTTIVEGGDNRTHKVGVGIMFPYPRGKERTPKRPKTTQKLKFFFFYTYEHVIVYT